MTAIHFAGEPISETRNRLAIAMGATGESDRYPSLARYAAEKGWRRVSLEEADVVVHALQYRPGRETQQIELEARARSIPCIFFRPNDDPTPVHLTWGRIYRASIFRSVLDPCESAMPALIDDVLDEVGELRIQPHRDVATVGFCGYVGSVWKRSAYRLTGRQEKVRGLTLRARALRRIRRSRVVELRSIERAGFGGGPNVVKAQSRDLRREFLENLIDANYALALRGMGNYSFRFYEILSAGQIPLFVDTDCVLPFEDQIRWKDHCVWLDEADLGRIDEIVAQFHADHSADDLRELQERNRRLWVEWLRPEAFYDHMLRRAIAEFGMAEAGGPPASSMRR